MNVTYIKHAHNLAISSDVCIYHDLYVMVCGWLKNQNSFYREMSDEELSSLSDDHDSELIPLLKG